MAARLIKVRGSVRSVTSRLVNSLASEIKETLVDEAKLEKLLNQIEQKEKMLVKLDQDVQDAIADDAQLEKDVEDALAYSDHVIEVKTNAQMTLRKLKETTRSITNGSATAAIKLPKLMLSKYSGEPTQWANFWNRYKIAVHGNEGIKNNLDKFTYLQSYLEGPALRAIMGLPISEQSYDEAITILTKRFGCEDLIVDEHMNNLLKLEVVKRSSDVQALRRFYDALEIEIRSLKTLGIGTNTYGTLLRTILKKRLPQDILLDFVRTKKGKTLWDVTDLVDYLGAEVGSREQAGAFLGLESTSGGNNIGRSTDERSRSSRYHGQQSLSQQSRTRASSTATLNTVIESKQCIFCENSSHNSESCDIIPVQRKRDIIREQRRCYICMKTSHAARNCRSKNSICKGCGKKHHIILCEQNSDHSKVKNDIKEPTKPKEATDVTTLSTITPEATPNQVILLQTVRAKVHGANYALRKVRCLIDGGAHRTFIREEISRRLELPVVGEEVLNIYSFGNPIPERVNRRRVRVIMENLRDSSRRIEVEALETPHICSAVISIPEQGAKAELRKRGLELADEVDEWGSEDSELGILIGCDNQWRILTGRIERLDAALVASETLFGWSLQGPATASAMSVAVNSVATMTVGVIEGEAMLSNQIQAFWELDSLGIRDEGVVSNRDVSTLNNFENSITFNGERYEVRLPWNDDREKLGSNYIVAKKRTENLKKRLRTDQFLFGQYEAVLREQERLGIIEEVKGDSLNTNNPTYYLPHHAVVRMDKETTKFRIVYDGSSHEAGLLSLNQCLFAGPNLNPDLLTVLVRFRKFKIAFTADIEKAFLMISLSPLDRDAVRFLWFKSPWDSEMKTYRLARVPFGVTSSPFLLSATIQFHLRQNQDEYPDVCQSLGDGLYVDDLLSGESDVELAYQASIRMKKLMGTAGMNLRKWQSNSSELQEKWIEDTPAGNIQIANDNKFPEVLKVLGLTWKPEEDVLVFNLSSLLEFLATRDNTKRAVLQCVARIFDPIGLISPFLVRMKILFQQIWQLGISWDTDLPPDIAKTFQTWTEELPTLHQLKIPRHYYLGNSDSSVAQLELHVFCDASEAAYAAVAYVRHVLHDGTAQVALIASKTRVSPLKRLTLPRLELMAAVLGARLATYLKPNFPNLDYIRLWTDSTITLFWIRGSANKWKPFVGNRVSEIQSLTEPRTWNHVKGKENPADLPTRGKRVEDLINSRIWWEGPTWLTEDASTWPISTNVESMIPGMEDELRLTRTDVTQFSVSVEPEQRNILDLERFSSFSNAKRIASWVLRFQSFIRQKEPKHHRPLSAEELERGEKVLIRQAQWQDLEEEVRILSSGRRLAAESKLYSFNPILDQDGLLRLGGRLEQSEFSYNEKHPYILMGKNRLSELIILFHHKRLMHAGLRDTLLDIREKFWITRGRQVTKTLLRKCVKCKRFTAKPGTVDVAPLPSFRITETPPFNHTGVDFAGPIHVKNQTNTTKAYIALFTCSVTRALHLEMVSDQTTDKFLMSFRRFISRRGIPSLVFSDNSKTFKRAEQDLRAVWRNLKSPEILEFIGGKGISWRYIIDRASWWGGFYERLVKSVKLSLKKVFGNAVLNYEELETILTEIEAILNSRPLTFQYNDPGEPSALTPGHLLIGHRLTSLPSRSFPNNEPAAATQKSLTRRLKYRQNLLDKYWTRWKKEYVLELRSANLHDNPRHETTLKVNDLVLIFEDKLPRSVWKMAIVHELIQGRDNKIRACVVKTGNGQYIRRPLQLLFPLEVQDQPS